ncbi:MAG: TIGR01777 family oxidoreductase [Prolixibacteraceae bacterium]
MQIAITGASGFIATSIQKVLKPEQFQFVALNRNESDEIWIKKLQQCQVVINLAGAPVIQRWTKKNRQAILNSRIQTTRRIVSLLNGMKGGPELLISGSAIGIYPDSGNEVQNEDSRKTGDGFLTSVVQQWESEAQQLTNGNIRLIIARIGVVIGQEGGLLKKTLPLFKMGLGGKIASGEQALSFIHINDIVKAFQFFIENKGTTGIYNLVAPNWVNNAEFTRALARAVHRPAIFPVPAFALKFLYGKAAQIMINGEKVYPKRLLSEGFVFKFPTIEGALKQ